MLIFEEVQIDRAPRRLKHVWRQVQNLRQGAGLLGALVRKIGEASGSQDAEGTATPELVENSSVQVNEPVQNRRSIRAGRAPETQERIRPRERLEDLPIRRGV